jgi:transposase-like protein
MIEVIDARAARQALAAGRLACPSCGGMLRPWGRTGERTVVEATGAIAVRLDRARCRSCRATHVVLPATLIPRRSYPLGCIAAALAAAGQGAGSRSVAARLDVPVGTVRSWLRRARDNADALFRFGVQTVVALNPDLLPTTPRPTQLGDALIALGAAAAAAIGRFTLDHHRNLWPVINVLTRGRLLAPTFSP